MNSKNLGAFIGEETLLIVEAMQKIDDNVCGVLFVTDEQKRLVGCLTDGDIRRWLIRTGNLKSQISKLMNPKPKYLFNADKEHAIGLMKKEKINAIPILDVEHKIVDIIFRDDIQFQKQTKDLLEHNVPVVIMAGGKGTRLYPYTKILPKPLIPIGDIPIIERIINNFCELGISQYYAVVNYKKNMIKSYFQELNPEYNIEYVEEEKPLGTAGGLKLIEKEFDKPLFVTNCDILVQANLSYIYKYHLESGNALTIISAVKNIVIPYGVLHSGKDGIVTSIEEKPSISYFVNTGMYILNPEWLTKIPNDTIYHMPDLANQLMKEGKKVGMYPISEDSFLDMGEFSEMRRMEEKLNI